MKCDICGKEFVEGDETFHLVQEMVLDDGTTEADMGVGDYCGPCITKVLPISVS